RVGGRHRAPKAVERQRCDLHGLRPDCGGTLMSQISARDISAMLARDAEGVARYLLGPNGKREGHELRYGDVGGAAGTSLGVHPAGDKARIWKAFSSGEGGDLLELWALTRNTDLGTAIREAKEHLGIRDVPLAGRQATAKPIEV